MKHLTFLRGWSQPIRYLVERLLEVFDLHFHPKAAAPVGLECLVDPGLTATSGVPITVSRDELVQLCELFGERVVVGVLMGSSGCRGSGCWRRGHDGRGGRTSRRITIRRGFTRGSCAFVDTLP